MYGFAPLSHSMGVCGAIWRTHCPARPPPQVTVSKAPCCWARYFGSVPSVSASNESLYGSASDACGGLPWVP